MGDVLAVQADLAARRVIESRDEAKQGRLAASRGAEKGEELVLPDGDGDVVERGYLVTVAAEGFGDGPGFDGHVVHRYRVHAVGRGVGSCGGGRASYPGESGAANRSRDPIAGPGRYSTVTLLARLRGWSMWRPSASAQW